MTQPFEPLARAAIRTYSRWEVRRRFTVDLHGLERLPRRGPVLLAARHYHHLYDGLLLLGFLSRPVHLLVGLDWVRGPVTRRVLETACAGAEWPVVLRPENLRRIATSNDPQERSAYSPDEIGPYLRRAMRDAQALFHSGRVLAMFPEGYPNVDLRGSRKPGADDFLPFQPGFLTLVEHAQRSGRIEVPIVPVGFEYGCGDGERVAMRLGAPIYLRSAADRGDVLREVEERVRALSGVEASGAYTYGEPLIASQGEAVS